MEIEFTLCKQTREEILSGYIILLQENRGLEAKIEQLQNTVHNSDKEIEDLKKISPDHVSYLEEMSRLKQELSDLNITHNMGYRRTTR